MRKTIRTLLAIVMPLCVNAQQKCYLDLDVFAKKSLMYANSMDINTANDYHFSSPLTAGANLLISLPLGSKSLFQAGLGYSPSSYALKFLVDSNSFVYKYTAGLKIGTFKLPVRFQYTLTRNFSLMAGVSFNYSRIWSPYTSKDYYFTSLDNYDYTASYDNSKTSYLKQNFVTFSGDLAVKYRLLNWLEVFGMVSYDWGKYPAISSFNQFEKGNHLYIYQGAICPGLVNLSLGASFRLKTYGEKNSYKSTAPKQANSPRVNVDILNGVLPQ